MFLGKLVYSVSTVSVWAGILKIWESFSGRGISFFLFHIVSRATVRLALPIQGLEMILSLE
jgi:hypothetical protein